MPTPNNPVPFWSSTPPPPPALPAPADFVERAREMGIEFEPGDVERLGLFLAMLLEANKTHNLTAITDPTEAWSKHILDALTLIGPIATLSDPPADAEVEAEPEEPEAVDPLHHHPHQSRAAGTTRSDVMKDPLSIIDVGSGGGVPAIPLAIVMPDVRFSLLEATGKKAEFLSQVKRALDLRNVRVINDRSEKVGQEHKIHREKYDAATARALGHLAVVAELTGPLVKPGGVVLAVKGAKAEQEIEEAHKAFGMIGLRHVHTIQTATGRIVVLEKTTRTPRLYPRKDGEPKRSPLGMRRSRDSEGEAPGGLDETVSG